MISISLCMIVKNEEEVLAGCLDSVKGIADEFIIVDTGSADATKEVAARYTDMIYDFEWTDHFADARNFAFSKASKDYILWMDADDVLTVEDRKKLADLKISLSPDIDAVSMYYHVGFDERGEVNFKYRRNRLVKREKGFRWIGAVHEYLEVYGNILETDIAVTHRKHHKTAAPPSDRNLKIYEKMVEGNQTLTPRDLFYFANELKDHKQYNRAITYYHHFLATKQCWIEDEIRTCQYLSDCYRALGHEEAALHSLLKSFLFDQPRPEFCCRLGDYFKEKQKYREGAFWYELALSAKRSDSGFTQVEYSTWYPHLQLCVCYWQLGDKDTAKQHNDFAASFHPTHPSVLFNKNIFAEQSE
ncbi:glycosyltransferase family 2 protein [Bacillus atrophaeus]|uniref:tetratricopeptide repeat-containing glycosyltransferase family 2 protein n=2 Tax=Bacillus atrophaeus TaxID=1452 RepID=UPI00227FF9A0|nr:glycosyltransferase family 2 protein [Bacillus atrophaeus]MCY8950949.1 glycosyltransferase family 2 protein [Bacillus atrophaeus]MCY8967834.1 glycosyltransferase family 2 protein [Bacillus atrophaeus]